MDLAGQVRRLRVARGLTQRELAEPHYTRAFIAAIEAGVRTPSDDALARIASGLGVDVEDLRYGRPPGAADVLRERIAEARRALSHGELAQAAAAFRAIREEAVEYHLPEIAGWAAYYLGDVSLHVGDVGPALEAYDRVAEELPDGASELSAAVVARQAYAYFAVGDTVRALAILEDELKALRTVPGLDADAELRIATALMYVFNELDWSERAQRLEREASALLPRVRNVEWVAQFSSIAAQLRRAESELVDVERLLDQARRLYEELGLGRELGMCHWARGYVLRRVDRLADAETEFRLARSILASVGALQDTAGATLELAEVLRQLGAPDEAVALATEAARTCAASRHLEGMAEADRLLGLISGGRGDVETAERHLRRAADRYESARLMSEMVTTCRLLGDLLLREGRRDEAMTVFRRGLDGAEKIR